MIKLPKKKTIITAGVGVVALPVVLFLLYAIWFYMFNPMPLHGSPCKIWKNHEKMKVFFDEKFIFPEFPDWIRSFDLITTAYISRKDNDYSKCTSPDDFYGTYVRTKYNRNNGFYWTMTYMILDETPKDKEQYDLKFYDSLVDISTVDNIETLYYAEKEMLATQADFILNNTSYSICIIPHKRIGKKNYVSLASDSLSQEENAEIEKTTKETLNSMINSLIEQSETKGENRND